MIVMGWSMEADAGMASMGHWNGSNFVGWGRGVLDNWGSVFVDGRGVFDNWCDVLNDWGDFLDISLNWLSVDGGLETVVFIGCVGDCAAMTVGIDQRVFALDVVTVTGLLLAVHVTGMLIIDIVGEFVFGRGGWVFHMLVHGHWRLVHNRGHSLHIGGLVCVVHWHGHSAGGSNEGEENHKLKRKVK
jgi:hypothetical protein